MEQVSFQTYLCDVEIQVDGVVHRLLHDGPEHRSHATFIGTGIDSSGGRWQFATVSQNFRLSAPAAVDHETFTAVAVRLGENGLSDDFHNKSIIHVTLSASGQVADVDFEGGETCT